MANAKAAYLAYKTGVIPRMYAGGQWIEAKKSKNDWEFEMPVGPAFDRTALIYIGDFFIRTIYIESIEVDNEHVNTVTLTIPVLSTFV